MNLFEKKFNVWLFVGILLACFAVSAGVRYQQFETWEQTPQSYFVGDRPMMTTLDAPYWLRWAREYKEGQYGNDVLRTYPSQSNKFTKQSIPDKFVDNFPPDSLLVSSEKKYSDIPLLSFLIAHMVPFFDGNYYLTGTLLIPVLASLFILPLGIYFFQLGIPVSGLLGGLIGTFASGYYMRSSIGRIDTDMLNLFFPLLAGLLILLAGKARTERNVLLYSVGAGLSLFLFQWWYLKPGFTLAFFIVLILSLFIQKIHFKIILFSAFLFVLFAQPATFMNGTNTIQSFLNSYFTIEEVRVVEIDNGTTPASFPNTLTTISEANHVPLDEVLRRVLSNTTLDWIGLVGLIGMAVIKWRLLIPLLPILALGLLSFQSSNRFIMYLAPFIGIGLGWLWNIGIDVLFQCLPVKNEEKTDKNNSDKVIKIVNNTWWDWTKQGVLYSGMALFFLGISSQTAISYVPRPSIHTGLYATILEVKRHIPKNSALLTWWDYGYAITDATGLATFHDGGGNQSSPKTYFIARSLISHDPKELYEITQYLATEGNRGISKNNTSPEALLKAVRNPTKKPWDPIYVFFTADMTGKYGAISKLGSWDIKNGGSKPRGYQNLACNKITNVEMNCRGAKIDLKTGKINNQVALKRMLFIREGQVMREQKFGHTKGYTLQMLVSGTQVVEVQLIDEEVFRSNYNQMFLLGRYRKDLYEETYNAFPFSRLYRIKY